MTEQKLARHDERREPRQRLQLAHCGWLKTGSACVWGRGIRIGMMGQGASWCGGQPQRGHSSRDEGHSASVRGFGDQTIMDRCTG